jgi:hypothetical protein
MQVIDKGAFDFLVHTILLIYIAIRVTVNRK